jgi:hypothetical protein
MLAISVEPGTGNQPGSGNQDPPESTNNNPQQTQAPSFQIDPRFANLPPEEAIARTVQSMVTPLHQQIKELTEKEKKYTSYLDSLSLITEDPEARRAFIRELDPELVQPEDIDDVVKSKLDKKYGTDFKVDREEAANDHWSKSAKYLRDMEHMYNEEQEKSSKQTYKTFAEIKKEIAGRKIKAKENEDKQLSDIQVKYQLNDATVNDFIQYLSKATIEDHFLNYRNVRKFDNNTSIASVPGSGLTLNEKMKKVDNLFGNSRF